MKITKDSGTVGDGEGMPDSHVTGETFDSNYYMLVKDLAPLLFGYPPEDKQIRDRIEHQKEYLKKHSACKLIETTSHGKKVYTLGYLFFKCRIVVSNENGRWHMRISRKYGIPNPMQVAVARYSLLPHDIEFEEISGLLAKNEVHLLQRSLSLQDDETE